MSTLPTRAPHSVSAAPAPLTIPVTDHPVGRLDRLTLRLGLWLLTRHAARIHAIERRAAAVHRARQRDAQRTQRERDWYRAAALQRPPA
ncbi:hypothetical protein IFU40_07250 [Microbacterium sp. CFBP 13617]|uniref:hypothetical protein n=1 Tax=unclassified Microbacterium TaxID=2609290 RepID=UPI0012E380E2|nr:MULTISPECIES: hypothetical protein [unclassified Microbacterium]MBD8218426.1 hypothetical protein [Microbacterium sp. CFBP 13617]